MLKLVRTKRVISNQTVFLQKLFLSDVNSTEKKTNPSKPTSQSFIDQYRSQLTQAAIVSGVGITLYGLSTFMWDLTYGLMNMTPFQSGYYGFLTGLATSGVLGGAGYYTKKTSIVSPSGTLRKVMYTLNSNSDIRIAFGGSLVSSELSAFKSTNAFWKIENWKPVWHPARVEMIFKVHSGKTEGIVTAIATQHGLHSQIEFLGVDVFNRDALRVLVIGDSHDFALHDAMRSKVTFN